jgi:hypothetical protein
MNTGARIPRLLWLLLVVGAIAGTFAAAVSFTEAANQRTARRADTAANERLLRQTRDLSVANQQVLEVIRQATGPEAQNRQRAAIDEAVQRIVDELCARLDCPPRSP